MFMGPLLFNIYINDFPLVISTISEVIMFADDTSILCTAKDCNNLKSKLNVVLTHLILLVALGPGVYSASNRNEYQKHKNNVSGE
jgi:hypothetical protein